MAGQVPLVSETLLGSQHNFEMQWEMLSCGNTYNPSTDAVIFSSFHTQPLMPLGKQDILENSYQLNISLLTLTLDKDWVT